MPCTRVETFCFKRSHFSFCWLEELSLLWLICWYKSADELPRFLRYSFKPHVCSLAAKCGEILEFSDVCKKHLGKPGEVIAVLFSLAAISGTAIVYWVLMSNFLYYSGTYIHGKISFLFFVLQLFVFMLVLVVKTRFITVANPLLAVLGKQSVVFEFIELFLVLLQKVLNMHIPSRCGKTILPL